MGAEGTSLKGKLLPLPRPADPSFPLGGNLVPAPGLRAWGKGVLRGLALFLFLHVTSGDLQDDNHTTAWSSCTARALL